MDYITWINQTAQLCLASKLENRFYFVTVSLWVVPLWLFFVALGLYLFIKNKNKGDRQLALVLGVIAVVGLIAYIVCWNIFC